MTRRVPVAALVLAGALVGGAPVASTRAQASTTSATNRQVIVVLRNQYADVPASRSRTAQRGALTGASQAHLVSDARAHGASDIHQLHVLNAFTGLMSADEATRLSRDPAVAAVVPDRTIRLTPPAPRPSKTDAPAGPVSSTTCPANPNKPLLEPEALQLTHDAYANPATPSAQQLADGAGVTVAYIADGIDINNPDFTRSDGSHVFVDYRDFTGAGPHAPTSGLEAFTDASAIAAQGRVINDLSDYVTPAHPLPTGCTIRVLGMAPRANLVGLVAFGPDEVGTVTQILDAIDYAVSTDHVDVINESFDSNTYPDTGADPIALIDAQLVAAGITVVNSTGDSGPANTIGSPASTPGVISVGASTSFRAYAQTTLGGFQLGNGTYKSDNISAFSSSGESQLGTTLDLVAPGDLGWADCSPNLSRWSACSNNNFAPSSLLLTGGTSQSAPYTAATAALVIQAYRQTHHGKSPSPAIVQTVLTGTATDLDLPADEQGAGLLNALRAVQAARSMPGATEPAQGSALIARPTQLDVAMPSGAERTRTITVTNVGATRETITPSLQTEDHVVRRDDFSVTMSPETDPTFVDDFGVLRSYRSQRVTVPPGVDRLAADIAWPNPTTLVRLVLVDPDGAYSAFSNPQNVGSFGSADVRNPKPGTWTAYLWTRAASNGYAGPVELTTRSYRRTAVGSATPGHLTLAPGHSARVQVQIPAGDAGDTTYALQFGAPTDRVAGVVPVVARTLVATGPAGGTFAGSFDGGNGRGIPSPTRTYEFDVPPNRPALALNLHLGDPAQATYGTLVDPHGQPISLKTNRTVAADGTVTYGRDLQFLHRAPESGRWRFVFTVAGPVSGNSTSTPYSGQLRYTAPTVTATGLPTNSATVLPAGQPTTARIQIVNGGAATAEYYADARTTKPATAMLVGHLTNDFPIVPNHFGRLPYCIVPTETSRLTVIAHADRSIRFDMFPVSWDIAVAQDPDVASPTGLDPRASVSSPIIAAQPWAIEPSVTGPFDSRSPVAHADFAIAARTRSFDRATISSTGDPQLRAIDPAAPRSHPLTIAAGRVGTIRITITPSGPPGDVVRGVLYINSLDPATRSSDEVIALRYEYTIG